jgi:putative ABC transport system substrate-binding protein
MPVLSLGGRDMRRREFLGAICGVAALPAAARAQQNGPVRRIGFFSAGRNNAIIVDAYQAFVDQMRKLGYAEGGNLSIDSQTTEQDADRILAAAKQMIAAGVDLIVSSGPEVSLQASIKASPTTPIVMVAINYDPLARGYVQSLARPGGRITGVSLRQTELAEKQVEILTQAFPQRKKLAIIWDTLSADQFSAAAQRARTMGLNVSSMQLREPPYDFSKVFRDITASGADMALFQSSPFFAVQSRQIGELAARVPLPTMFIFRGYVASGGLISYGAEPTEIYRQAATQAAKILRGANPADLPVELPKAFELSVNLKTAKAIGLEMPTSLLLRADEVIE